MENIKNLLKAKSAFRGKSVVLVADKKKTGGGGEWNFASEENLIKTIQEPLIECGLEFITTVDTNKITATLYHVETGENISSSMELREITGKVDRNGNVMYLDAEIERGKQIGYWRRVLTIGLLGLSDIDPEAVTTNAPVDVEKKKEKMIAEYNELHSKIDDTTRDKFKEYLIKQYNTDNIETLQTSDIVSICTLLKAKIKNSEKADDKQE